MATLAYRLRIRDASNLVDDLIVTSLDVLSLDTPVIEVTDDFEGYADSAALLGVWNLAPGDQSGSTLALDSTGGVSGSKAAKLTGTAGSTTGLHIGSRGAFPITGLQPNTAYTISAQIKTDFDPVDGFAFGEGPVGIMPDNGVPVYITTATVDAFQTLTATGTSDGSGNLTVYFGWGPHNGLTGTRNIWCDAVNVIGPGSVANYPYIVEPPEGDGQTLNPVTGEVQVGGFNVSVIDALIDTDTRVITAKLSDTEGRNALLSRRAFIEETEDGGDTWTVLMAGFVNGVRMVSAIRFEFSIGESRRVEQRTKVFERIEDGFDRVSCIIGGPVIGGFGPYDDLGRPRFEVEDVTGDVVRLLWIDGNLHVPFHETGPPIRANVRDYLNALAMHYVGPASAAGPTGTRQFPGLTARLFDVATGPNLTSNPPTGFTADECDFTPLGITFALDTDSNIITTDGRISIYWPAARGDQPTVGDQFKLAIFPRQISERNPLHWTGHPIDLATGLLTLRGESYDATSADDVKAELGDTLQIEIRPTGAMTLSEALETLVYGPFGVATRTNDAGEREFFTTRRRPSSAPTDTLTVDDLTSDEGTAWATEEGSAVNKVVFKTADFSQLGPAFVSDPITQTDDAIDFISADDVTVEASPDPDSEAVFGAQTVTYEIPGRILGMTAGTDDLPGTLDQFVGALAFELFDFQGRGAITMELNVRRGVTDALIGQEVIVDVAHVPTASAGQTPTTQRGTIPRVAVVLRRTNTPSGPVFKLQDRGPFAEATGLVPEFTLTKSTADPRKIATVTITNGAALIAAGVMVRVEMATGGSPTSGHTVRILDPNDVLVFDLPAVDAGAVVWARLRAEVSQAQPGAWSAFASVDLDDLDAPTDFTGTFTGLTIALSWALGANAADIPIEVLYRLTGDTDWISAAFLPAGTLSYALTVALEATQYDFGVRHHEASPFSGVSPITTLLAQTSGSDDDTPDPPGPDDPPPEPPIPGAGGGAGGAHVWIPFHASLSNAPAFDFPPADLTELGQFDRRRVDLTGYAKVRVHVQTHLPLPIGGRVAVQYVPATNEEPEEADWEYLDGTSGPVVPVEEAAEIPIASSLLNLALEARQDVILRAVSEGGDDVTRLDIYSMAVEFQGAIGDDTDEPVPDPCEDSTVSFGGYDDQAALEADWTFVQGDMPSGAMTLDLTGGETGGRAMKFSVSACDACIGGGQSGSTATFDITGLTPAVSYTVVARVKIGTGFGLGETFAAQVAQDTGTSDQPDVSNTGWQDLTFTDTPRFDSGTTLRLRVGFSAIAGFSVLHNESFWITRITVTSPSGEIISPCSGGPTIPGDGGYDPGTPGDPPVLPPSGPRKLYLTGYQQQLWGDFPPFNGCLLVQTAGNLIATLDAAQAIGLGVFLVTVSGGSEGKVGGVFSQSAYLEKLETFASIGATAAAHPALKGIRVMDEPSSVTHWGTQVQYAVVDGVLAKRTSEIFPGVPLHLRDLATRVEASGLRPSYLQIMQIHWLARHGPVADFMARERAAAQRLQMAWGWGMNPLNGGSGSSGIAGEQRGWWQMSPTEIQTNGVAMAQDTAAHSFSVWAGVPTPDNFLQGAAYQAAFQAIVDALG